MQTQHPFITAAGPTQIQHSAEMGIGVVMAAHQLIPVTDHRPAALQMQRNLTLVKTDRHQILLSLRGDLGRQIGKVGVTVQLPDAVDVAGPGATVIRVTRCTTTQSKQVLQQACQLQGIQGQLNRGHSRRKQLMNLKPVHRKRRTHLSLTLRSNKKAGPEGPAERED